ncbi:uncharacterized protein RHO17_019763 [Thomomys bottae]
MATPRPRKQRPPLLLASASPRRPWARAPRSGCNSLGTPFLCRPLPRHPAPYPPPCRGAFPPEGPALGAQARDSRPSPRERPPPPLPASGSHDPAQGRGASAGTPVPGLRATLSRVPRVSLVAAGRPDSPMPPAAHIRRGAPQVAHRGGQGTPASPDSLE